MGSQIAVGVAPKDSRIQLKELEKRKDLNDVYGFVLDYNTKSEIYTLRLEKPDLTDEYAHIPMKVRCKENNIFRGPEFTRKMKSFADTWDKHLQRPFTNVSDCDVNIHKLLLADEEEAKKTER